MQGIDVEQEEILSQLDSSWLAGPAFQPDERAGRTFLARWLGHQDAGLQE